MMKVGDEVKCPMGHDAEVIAFKTLEGRDIVELRCVRLRVRSQYSWWPLAEVVAAQA